MNTITAHTEDDRLLTSHQVGELLQVNPSSINKWVNDGRISAFRTPGGHRRIRVADLVTFLNNHKMPIPRSLSSATRPRLLIVDDNVKHLDALKRRLKPYLDRLELATASTGIDAVVAVGAFKPNLLVLDVYMPDLDGLAVCRRLKENHETQGINVIMTSGSMTPEIEEEALKAGALVCLAKPMDIAVVLEHLGVAEQPAR